MGPEHDTVTKQRAPEAPQPPSGDAPRAQVVGLVKVYGQGQSAVRAVDGVDLSVPAGRFVALMGPSGSGKSTLLHCMAGLDRPTSGEVRIAGTDLAALKERDLTILRRDQLGFVFQSFNLVPTLTARENILLPMRLGRRRPDARWVDRVVDTLGLRDRLDHRPAALSGGEQQRVAVARALVSRPQLVYADEPTGNLDRGAGARLLSFLRGAVDDFGQTVVMVTHDAGAAAVADSVLFLADGRIVGEQAEPTLDGVLDHLRRLEG